MLCSVAPFACKQQYQKRHELCVLHRRTSNTASLRSCTLKNATACSAGCSMSCCVASVVARGCLLPSGPDDSPAAFLTDRINLATSSSMATFASMRNFSSSADVSFEGPPRARERQEGHAALTKEQKASPDFRAAQSHLNDPSALQKLDPLWEGISGGVGTAPGKDESPPQESSISVVFGHVDWHFALSPGRAASGVA